MSKTHQKVIDIRGGIKIILKRYLLSVNIHLMGNRAIIISQGEIDILHKGLKNGLYLIIPIFVKTIKTETQC